MLYNDVDFLDRFAAAAHDGFQAVEYLFPYAYPAQELATRLQASGLQQVLFNAPPGDWDAGERGLACLPGREAEFREGMAKAIEYAQALQCPRIHVMAGLVPQGADAASVLATHIATREATQAMADDLFAVVASGQVKIHIDQRYPLAEVQQAHRDLEAPTFDQWLAGARQAAQQPPAQLRQPLVVAGQVVGSVAQGFFNQISLERLMDKRYQLSEAEHSRGLAWHLRASPADTTDALNTLAAALRDAGLCGPWRDKILIANRGEIALRVLRAAKEL
eukprot:gene39092-52824_t